MSTTLELSAPALRLLRAMQAGVTVSQTIYNRTFNPRPKIIRNDSGENCGRAFDELSGAGFIRNTSASNHPHFELTTAGRTFQP